MNNHKDIKKTNTDYQISQNNDQPASVPNPFHSMVNKDIFSTYEFASKKTEKLVTALYMVTDCMDTDDALKSKLRAEGVELLSDMHKLASLTPIQKNNQISLSLGRIHEIVSFIDITSTIGYISEMNSLILRNEFAALSAELDSFTSKDTHFSFTLTNSMFDVPRADPSNQTFGITDIKDKYKGQDIKDKRTYMQTLHENPSTAISSYSRILHNRDPHLLSKNERSNKILAIIKEYKKTSLENGEQQGLYNGVSIKDISAQFTDCSEKTIQRELNDLVIKGRIKKSGSKRWSRYLSIES